MKELSAKDAYDAWQAGNVAIVDVRELNEHEVTSVPGVALIPMSELQGREDELPTDRPLVIMCRSGRRSAQVAEYLEEVGDWGEVTNLDGGILAWAAEGLAFDGEPPQ